MVGVVSVAGDIESHRSPTEVIVRRGWEATVAAAGVGPLLDAIRRTAERADRRRQLTAERNRRWRARHPRAAAAQLSSLQGRDRPPKTCSTCGMQPAAAGRECNTCRSYRNRTGRPRPETLIARNRQRAQARAHSAKRLCATCEWRPVRAGDECRTCYMYRRRTGRQRPEALVVSHARRVADRLDEQRRVPRF